MIGFVTDNQTAAAIAEAIGAAQDARGVRRYLHLAAFPIFSGPHAGWVFLPFSDSDMEQPMHGGLRLRDFPELWQLAAMIGGLDARVEIDAADITEETEL